MGGPGGGIGLSLLVNVIGTLLLILVLLGLGFFEGSRFLYVQEGCNQRHVANQKLLQSDVCHGKGFGGNAIDTCNRAAIEVEVPVLACAVQEWWRGSEVYALYMRCAETNWLFLALAFAAGSLLVYKVLNWSSPQPGHYGALVLAHHNPLQRFPHYEYGDSYTPLVEEVGDDYQEDYRVQRPVFRQRGPVYRGNRY